MTGRCCVLAPAGTLACGVLRIEDMLDADIHSRPTRFVRTPNLPVLDGYAVEHLLHESAASTIYRARYLPRGERVVLKILHPALARDPVQVSRFRREIRCLYRMRGRGAVRAYDHGTTACGTHFVAMELLEGDPLDRYLRQRGGALHWREALHIQRAICVSLGEARGHGIVHRGIRPSHIVLGAGGEVTLIDFGLARFRAADPEDDPSAPEHGMGTPARLLAPAQRAGAQADSHGDCHALAAMTLELILGRELVMGGPPSVLPKSVPREVERLLLRCLSTNPTEQFGSPSAIVAEIDRICAVAASPRRMLGHTPAFELEPPQLPRLFT